MCACHCAHLLYTTQHITVLIIFPNLQIVVYTVAIAQMLSLGGEGLHHSPQVNTGVPD